MLKRRVPRPVSKHFIVLGVCWLLVGSYLTIAGLIESLSHGATRDTFLWPILGLLALSGAYGLITGRPYSRGVIAFCAGLGLLGVGTLSVFALYPQHLFWWVGVLVGAFFAWSLFFVVKLWPDYEVLREAAG
jgi:hypothetical protein